MDLGEVVAVVRKRLSWIATAAVVGLVTSGLWTFTRAPLFKATAQIEVVGPPQADLVKEAGLTVAADSSEFETHRYLLTTDRILDAVVTSVDLPTRLGIAGAGSAWLRAHVTVDRVPDTRIFRITATAPEPKLAADIANAIAKVYRQDDVDRRSKGSEKTLNSLNEQLLTVKKDVEGSEMALIQYIDSANLDLVDVPSGGESDAKGSDLNPSGSKILAGLEEDLEAKRRELDDERIDRTEEHPAIQRLKQQISNREKQIANEKKRVTEENKKRIRYGMLKRDAELNRELLQVLMKALKEANLLGDAPQERIDVLEDAVPPDPRRPVSPRPAVNLGMGLGAGILFGIGLAFLQESLDRTLKEREEIERALGLAVLGVVHRVRRDAPAATGRFRGLLAAPAAPGPSAHQRFVLKADGSWSPELEDFRSLRTNLRFARPEGENKTVLVTSTAPQEGKTTIATNLAIVAAQAGERVLLVDADLRRPAVHLALSMENGRGLTNLLVERAGEPEGDALTATAWPNLTVITAGAFAPNPPEILESARCAELIAGWRKRFDRVIIDSPPQSSVVDPAILAPRVDGVLLVVASGRVEAERARLARRQLAAAGAKFFGAVVNQLSRSRDAYSYGYDYGYGTYGYGYGNRGNGNGGEATEEPRERPSAGGK